MNTRPRSRRPWARGWIAGLEPEAVRVRLTEVHGRRIDLAATLPRSCLAAGAVPFEGQGCYLTRSARAVRVVLDEARWTAEEIAAARAAADELVVLFEDPADPECPC